MTFSVIIPAYNAAATLDRCLRSCMDQSYPALEIVVVDDASNDGTTDVALAHPSVRLIRLEHNKGVAHARNTGWAAASGDYIVFLDSDDVWHEDKLRILKERLEQDKAIDALFHSYTTEPFIKGVKPPVGPLRKLSFFSLLLRNKVQSSCICVARGLPFRFKETLRYCEDFDLVLNLAHHVSCWQLEARLTCLHHPQLYGTGLSSQHWNMRKGELRIYAGIWRYHLWLIPFIPLLLLFSLVKHVRKKWQLYTGTALLREQ